VIKTKISIPQASYKAKRVLTAGFITLNTMTPKEKAQEIHDKIHDCEKWCRTLKLCIDWLMKFY
jgi:hypothetical protein